MPAYNGHRSWNAWNVSLWIANDESLYHLALECLNTSKNLRIATTKMMRYLSGDKTPDGANYNATCVRLALAGLKD